jgi:hypothetical protein
LDAANVFLIETLECLVLAEPGPLTRLFVRDCDRIVPVAAAEIERLEPADDYVEVHTKSRSYLVYLMLNDFERRLDPERFIRDHRAHIVNLDFVKQLVSFDRSRMQVEMRDGRRSSPVVRDRESCVRWRCKTGKRETGDGRREKKRSSPKALNPNVRGIVSVITGTIFPLPASRLPFPGQFRFPIPIPDRWTPGLKTSGTPFGACVSLPASR